MNTTCIPGGIGVELVEVDMFFEISLVVQKGVKFMLDDDKIDDELMVVKFI